MPGVAQHRKQAYARSPSVSAPRIMAGISQARFPVSPRNDVTGSKLAGSTVVVVGAVVVGGTSVIVTVTGELST